LTDYYFWNNFWVNLRRKADSQKYADEVCRVYGIGKNEFMALPMRTRHSMIDDYIKNKDKYSGC
jgi:hypothetical protein